MAKKARINVYGSYLHYSPSKPSAARLARTPEERAKLDQFRAGIGQFLADNLNRSVMSEHGKK